MNESMIWYIYMYVDDDYYDDDHDHDDYGDDDTIII